MEFQGAVMWNILLVLDVVTIYLCYKEIVHSISNKYEQF